MAVQDIISYIKANEKAYTQDALIDQLRKSGYPEEEIQAALKALAPAVSSATATDIKTHVAGFMWGKIRAWAGGFLLGAVIFGAAAVGMIILAIATAFGGIENNWIFIALGAAIFLVAGGILSFILLRRKHPNFSWGILVATIIFGFFTVWAAFMIVTEFGYKISRNNINIMDARGRSRDARRISDIKQLQLALELYYDANSGYPEDLNVLQPKFIPQIPRDPQTGGEYMYAKHPDGSYLMGAWLEDPNARYLRNDVNPGNNIYEVSSESPVSSSSLKNSAITSVFDNSPRIIITNPRGSAVWKIGESHVITWETEGFTARNVNIYLYGLNGKDSESAFIARDLSNTGKYAWDTKMITLYTGNSVAVSAGRYRIFILSNLNQNDSRTSVNMFSEGWITLEL